MKALFICDPGWSTGSIVKSLQAVLRDWHIQLHDWSQPFLDSGAHDAVISMSITGPARNPSWRSPRMAAVLCGPGEMQLSEVLPLDFPRGVVLAGVSEECTALLQHAFPAAAAVHTTPGFPHPHVFTYRPRALGPIRRAGFVGRSTTQNMQVSGPAKRPEMFTEICAAAGIEAVFSEQSYRFEEMQQFYDSVDVVISTSSAEGGPFSPIEAIACGCPALSTNVGIIRDMLLPGRFDTVEECVKMLPHVWDLLPAQREIAAVHSHRSIAAWRDFLDHVATVRAINP